MSGLLNKSNDEMEKQAIKKCKSMPELQMVKMTPVDQIEQLPKQLDAKVNIVSQLMERIDELKKQLVAKDDSMSLLIKANKMLETRIDQLEKQQTETNRDTPTACQTPDRARNVYLVTFGEDTHKITLDTVIVEHLMQKIRQMFKIDVKQGLKVKIEDHEFPGKFVNLRCTDRLPAEAKIIVDIACPVKDSATLRRAVLDPRLVENVLSQHRVRIYVLADQNDVFLDRVLDHLMSKECIQRDQNESIKAEKTSRKRCAKLLDFVSLEGQQAFREFCKALEAAATDGGKQIADSLSQSMQKQRLFLCQQSDSTACRLGESVLAKYRSNIIRSADADDIFLDSLLEHLTSAGCIRRDQKELVKRETTSQSRCGKLLDLLSSQGSQAIKGLCDALERFETIDRKRLAMDMRKELDKRSNRLSDTFNPPIRETSSTSSCLSRPHTPTTKCISRSSYAGTSSGLSRSNYPTSPRW